MPTEVQIYKDGTIVEADIANNAVTNGKIGDGAVTPGKLSTGGPNWDASGYLTATGFKVGTQSGFLKADGTVDNLIGAGGNFTINNTAPTVFLQDTNNRSCMLHCNSNFFYVLRGDAVNSLSFAPYNGYWPLQINLENNDTTLGGNLSCVGDIKGSRAVLGPYAGSTTYNGSLANGRDDTKANIVGLEIKNNGGTGENDVAAISFHCTGNYGMHMHLRNDGVFGIGGWSALPWRWYVQMSTGNMFAAGDIYAFVSDERLKENIQPLENALDKVLTLNGFTYNFNETGQSLGFDGTESHIGVSAQQVQVVVPEAVKPAPVDSNYLTVQYEKLVPLLIEAIKEQQETITNLQNRLEILEGK